MATARVESVERRLGPLWRWARERGVLDAGGPVLGLVVLVVFFTIASDFFLTVRNTFNVLQQISVLAIVALGQTLVIITGGIDLSVGSVLALGGAVTGWTFAEAGWPMWLAVVAGIAIGAAAGLVNGLLITLGRLPPFIATLAMLSAARGFAQLVTSGEPISGYPSWFQDIGSYELFNSIPASVIVVAVLYVLGWFYLRYRASGRALYALGGNEEVARLSGLPNTRLKIQVYTVAGLLSAVAGLVLVARLNSVQPTAGLGLELDAIAAVVIGGASLAGGIGSVVATLVGALIIGVLRNGLNLLNVSSFWQQVVIGGVIAGAVLLDRFRKRTRP